MTSQIFNVEDNFAAYIPDDGVQSIVNLLYQAFVMFLLAICTCILVCTYLTVVLTINQENDAECKQQIRCWWAVGGRV